MQSSKFEKLQPEYSSRLEVGVATIIAPKVIFWSTIPLKLVTIGALVWLVSGIIATLVSYSPGLSFPFVITLLFGLVAGFAILSHKLAASWIAGTLVFLSVVFSFYYLTQNDFESRTKFSLIHSLSNLTNHLLPNLGWPKPHPNHAAGFLEVILPFGIVLFWLSKSVWLRTILLAACLLCAYTLFMTESRGGWSSLMLALAWVGLTFLYRRWRRGKLSQEHVLVRAGIIGLIVVALGALLIYLTLQSPALIKSSRRWDLQYQSLALISDYPFTGAGLGTFEQEFAWYVQFHNFPPEPYAHNLWLDLWISQGVLGVFGYGLITLGTALAVVRTLKSRQPRISPFFWASQVAWLALLIHGLGDDPHYQLWTLPLLTIIPTLVISQARLAQSKHQTTSGYPRRNRIALAVSSGLMLVLIGVIFLAKPLLSLFESNIGNLYQARAEILRLDNPATLYKAVTWLDASWQTWPDNPSAMRRVPFLYLQQKQMDKALLYHEHTGASVDIWPMMAHHIRYILRDPIFALEVDRKALALGTTNPRAYYSVAYDYGNQGNLPLAISTQKQGLLLDNTPDAEQYLRLGGWLYRNDDHAAALTAYKNALVLDPNNARIIKLIQDIEDGK